MLGARVSGLPLQHTRAHTTFPRYPKFREIGFKLVEGSTPILKANPAVYEIASICLAYTVVDLALVLHNIHLRLCFNNVFAVEMLLVAV